MCHCCVHRYKLDIDCNFNVEVFGGSKSIVISTTSWIGGKNVEAFSLRFFFSRHSLLSALQDFLAGSYLAVGSVCFALALAFLTKHVVR
jgi:hypothetical protein